ncbi:MAG: DUF4440 domain-containing protein [Hafnia alvei]|uniref:DUF4440 domain-containing protein n=1 Tax=Hafnia alvei TaxID=569 RepID=UPI003F912E7D
MSANNPYFVEVVESHELIQQWFANTSASETLCEQLLSHFSPAFTMVGMSGMLLNYPAVCAFFRANGGAKAGLSIEVSEMTIITEWENGAVVSYKETQTQPEQPKTVRFSTAVFEKDSQGKVLWRHLHETAAHL